jgi:DNA repair exonuclease SbcCD ATPase subunit
VQYFNVPFCVFIKVGVVMINLVQYREQLDCRLSERKAAFVSLERERKMYDDLLQRREVVQEANSVLQVICAQIQTTVHHSVSDIVTRCLRAVFGEGSYEFQILFEQKRGKVEAVMQFVRNGEIYDPMTQSGGGVLDVAAFGLRLSALLLSSNRYRRVLILDEPFRFLSVEYRCRIRDLIETLAKELDFQFIMITHIRELEIGDVVQIG